MRKTLPLILALGILAIFSSRLSSVTSIYNPQQEKIKEVLQQKFPNLRDSDIVLKELTNSHLQKLFSDIDFYHITLLISDPPEQLTGAMAGQSVMLFPKEFNALLAGGGISIDAENAIDIAFSFCQLVDPEAIPFIALRNETAEIQEADSAVAFIKFSTYSRLGGLMKDWEFTISNGQIGKIKETVTAKREGDYLAPPDDYGSYFRSLGIPKMYFPALYRSTGKPGQGQVQPFQASITTDKYYVTIRENGSATSQSERTVTFTVSGFDPNAQVNITVSSFNGSPGDFLNTTITTDGSGSGAFSWEVSGDAAQPSDLAEVSATGPVSGTPETIKLPVSPDGPFAIQDRWYETDPFNVNPDFALTILYCTGYENYVGSNAEDFRAAVRSAMVDSYDRQVTDWNFQRPFDGDEDYHVYINDGMNEFHNSTDNQAWSGNERRIGVRANSFQDFNYSSVQARVNAAVAHEFAHGIQYTYASGHGLIWGSEGKWVREGIARFIPSVQYEAEEFAQPEHLYPRDANDYLQNYLNTSLRTMSYRYCIYWRFLYENHSGATTDPQRLQVVERALTETANQAGLGLDAVEGGELAMNDALSGTGGSYSTFDESLINFARGNYILKLDDTDPNQMYDHLSTYSDPNITANITFDGSKEEFTNDISASFGMDFIEVSFQAPYNGATFYFDGGTGTDYDTDDEDDFNVALLVIDDNKLANEYTMTLDGTSEEGQLTVTGIGNDSGDRVAVIVTRLDNNEGDANATGNYKLTISTGIDVALVIDRSGSMGFYGFMEPAKSAASTFVGFMQTGDNVAVVSFNENSTVNFPFTRIDSEQTKTDAQNAIAAIFSDGLTSIGAGMQAAQGELNKGNTEVHQGMVLLSDGFENTPPFVDDVLPTIPENTDIYTIALGTNSDQDLLNQIADATGGIYSFSPDSVGLLLIYNTIRANVAGEEIIATFSGTVDQGQTVVESALVDGSVSNATYSVAWLGSDIDLILEDPNGRLITPDTALVDPNINFLSGNTYEFYTINLPIAGEWMLKITGVDLPLGSEVYSASVTGVATLKMEIFFDQSVYVATEPILISANIQDDGSPIPDANVTAEVQIPTLASAGYFRNPVLAESPSNNGFTDEIPELHRSEDGKSFIDQHGIVFYTTDSLTLFDDGAHGDGAANDGVYANFFTNTDIIGSYTFHVSASGTSTTSGPFTREAIQSTVVIAPEPDIDVTPTSFTFTLFAGESDSALMTIANTAPPGTDPIIWNITKQQTSLVSSNGLRVPIQLRYKTAEYERAAQEQSRAAYRQKAINRLNDAALLKDDLNPTQASPLINHNESKQILYKKDGMPLKAVTIKKRTFTTAAAFDIAVLGENSLVDALSDVQSKLISTGLFNSVTTIDITTVTPTLSDLLSFNAVLVFFNVQPLNSVALGDALADYVDAGGGVVVAEFAILNGASFPNWNIQGRFNTDNYWAIVPTDYLFVGPESLGTVFDPAHPVMDGVNSFNGGSSSYRPSSISLHPDAVMIAAWTDGNPLIAVREINGVQRVDLGLFPPSSDVQSDLWDATTDGARLMANALAFVAGGTVGCSWLRANPNSGSVPADSSVEVQVIVDASGLTAGTYDCNLLVHSNDQDEPVITIDVHLNVTKDALIWIPEDVIEPNLEKKAAQRGLSVETLRNMVITPNSHNELKAALEANGKGAVITNTLSANDLAGVSYLFVVLGVYPNNHVLNASDPEATVIEDFIASGGKVYMEGGDVWYFDPQSLNGYDFGPTFQINALADGANDLKTILGSNVASGKDFTYSGQNNFIDHLAPLAPAVTIHSNDSPAYDCGVAYDAPAGYRTIGASYEFGGLDDASISGSSKAALMAAYLGFFDTGLALATAGFDFPLQNGGWYLVSLPVVPEDVSVSALFPNAVAAFGWDYATQGYVAVTEFAPAQGYWLAMSSAATVEVTGVPFLSYNKSYTSSGWDLIGSVMSESSLQSDPNSSVFAMFGYNALAGQYESVRNFEPKQGYWIAVTASEQEPLFITVGSTTASSTASAKSGDLPAAFGSSPPMPPQFAIEGEELIAIPSEYGLLQNYPNPFNPVTVITYQLPEPGHVSLKIYTILGQEVQTLIDGEMPAGIHRVKWDARNGAGQRVESGVYIYRLHVNDTSGSGRDFAQSKKLILLK